ncbi:hypothetical protein FMJ45_00510 [Klebsiella michiganensis]|nr:hypothetical protein F7Q97_00340 [Klebsiella michiganensis]MBF8470175.1 hypothetical protein [Klebsiella michiganensis]MBZ6563398.1 hypothetical protein [Klebsiella michiganensis]MBZ6599652.1 hypothetical protein [Klebsiella michiganensis]MBZ7447797.1 hypothetical protein [Klebsiella michiganensis]
MVCEIIASAREDNVASATARRANPVSHPPGCTIFSEIAATLLFHGQPLSLPQNPLSAIIHLILQHFFHWQLPLSTIIYSCISI